jgi:hypothetical protein
MMARRFPEAVAQINKVIERDPSFVPAHFYLAQVYATQGRFPDAVNEIKKIGTDPASYSPDAQGTRLPEIATRPSSISSAPIPTTTMNCWRSSGSPPSTLSTPIPAGQIC